MSEPQKVTSLEETRIKAEHSLAKMDHEREMATLRSRDRVAMEAWLLEDLPELIAATPYGSYDIEVISDELTGKPVKQITLTTGGWSGNEEIIGAIPAIVDEIYWYMKQRGGKHVYRVPVRATPQDQATPC